jgi:hypothetical protein
MIFFEKEICRKLSKFTIVTAENQTKERGKWVQFGI